MHIFGVTLVCAFRNLKCSSIGWLEKPILPLTRMARLGLHALELDAVVEFVDLDAVEHAVEIEMPPGAAEFAVGGGLQPDLFLLLDDLLDLAVLDLFELGAVISPFSRLARASLIGAVRRKLPTWSARNGGLVRCDMFPPRKARLV